MLDTLILSRIQFASNMTFHILFPTISIALGWALFYFKVKFNKTGDSAWSEAYQFWVKIFALTFALGVVSGITMSFQFGTNWPGYMQTVGNIAGPLLGYEVLSAFFLEATFLGIMLFGSKRVSQRAHTIATFLVAFGTSLSAFWIIALDSWMQTPQGFVMINGQAHATNWIEIVFNPSMPYRLFHMMTASFLTVTFLIAGISSYRYLKGISVYSNRVLIKLAMAVAVVLAPLQIALGDLHGLNTLEHQPAKVAAMEGIWETTKGAPAVLFAIPDESAKANQYEIAIPKLASLYLTHSLNGEVKGLDAFPGATPPVKPIFFAFRIMVGIGMLMLLTAFVGFYLTRKSKELPTWLLKALSVMTFSGWVGVVAGWYVTEIGRQPYLVSGVLKTTDAVTQVPTNMVLGTLVMYLALYLGLIVSYIWVVFYLARQAHPVHIIDGQKSGLTNGIAGA
ncbi:cytochrome ubiquinol oxidase subunit I [Polynucleobacter asymbioticus]|jgi:cytochrome d ubiquinol oxidase subunit I|uniref:Cytochrome D ubiquinol oxidase subunit I n=1 Tax=Polynucleobacter asymbioticus TaxID=576611 RepID=A0AAC9NH24_9BURK|nr:cytochrome ubiquinol oxidase subunit I [Polynucleobacter asymbioticus]APB99548.1 cytochrome D ubiquinol oxidase subunit I [Polynucleobacter asymbioticus]APC01855.1 cytochrome D ubiquinol oxidase subunit I [Polynucleobacter asymbioticus]